MLIRDEKCHELIESLRSGNLAYIKRKLAKHPDWLAADISCKVSLVICIIALLSMHFHHNPRPAHFSTL